MRTPRVEPELLNLALELSLEWGESWRLPIQSRLLERRPQMDPSLADQLDAFARDARVWAHEIIASSGPTAEEHARRTILDALPWIDESTFAHLWSQGQYYARK
jgi:hypothetical protein